MMRILLLVLLVGSSLGCQNRLETLVQEATGRDIALSTDVHDDCNSQVGTFTSVHEPQYKQIINKVLSLAMKYMTISSHFARDTNHRLGFKKLFRDASDQRFQQAVDMIKYVVKRGGTVKRSLDVQMPTTPQYQPQPLPSLGLALTDAKDMYAEQTRLYRGALCLASRAGLPLSFDDRSGSIDTPCGLDPDLAHRSQDAIESEVERVNDLASKANQLSAMFTSDEHSLAEHLFDQHLM